MQLEISADEAQVLNEVLEEALGDTREQIYKAEVADYKTILRRREATLTRLLERLRSRPAVS
jgi:hypothetical protein